MATSLIAEFVNASGNSQSITWSNIDPEVPASAIKAFLNAVVTSSASVLKVALTSLKSAKLRTTTETPVDLS